MCPSSIACPSSVCTSILVNIGSRASQGGDPLRPPVGATRRRGCVELESMSADGWYDGAWNDWRWKTPDYWSSSSSSMPVAYSWTWEWQHHAPRSHQWSSVDTTNNDPRQCGDEWDEVLASFNGTNFSQYEKQVRVFECNTRVAPERRAGKLSEKHGQHRRVLKFCSIT